MSSDQAVTLGPSQGVGQDLVGDALDAVVEVLVAAAAIDQFGKDNQSPTPCKDAYRVTRGQPVGSHAERGVFSFRSLTTTSPDTRS